ncbi:MAG: SDR family NAD(P)-dependent oxidoreductase [Acidobacteriota bacterium]
MESEQSMVPDNAVAVIGMAGRFPGARTLEDLWAVVQDGRECLTFFTPEELIAAGVDADLVARPAYVRARGVLDDVDSFDAACFGFSAREAELTDPQHRLFLECALEVLEHAGYAPAQTRGSIGVFAGAAPSSYLLHHLAGRELAATGAQIGIGNSPDFLATRVAYKLDLKGPAYTVQSACSTSLLAVHLACQHLLAYECDLAIAGGVSLVLPIRAGYLFQEDGMLSPDGHCRPFDAAARGTVFGSGVGLVALKRLDEALAEHDTIHAIVLGSAVNNDGSLKAGYTAPSVGGQAAVITEALANAAVPADSIGYLEAHGTGTSLGDPIEVSALTQAFRTQTERTGFCALGALKANIGHLDTAAGIAGFIKTVLVLRERRLPPLLHFTSANPAIDFAASPFVVPTTARPWIPAPGVPRRAGISAFGVGGTNVHVVLQEAPPLPVTGPARTHHLLPLSARTSESLDAAAIALVDHFDAHAADLSLADAAYTLQVGRRACEHRRAVVCGSLEEAMDRLEVAGAPEVASGVVGDRQVQVAFLCPGLGVQAAGMAAELYASEAVFREALDRGCASFAPHLDVDLREVLTSPATSRTIGLMARIDVAEAALFAFEHAVAQLLGSWGIRPDLLIGHSLGEYVAACLAGVFSLADAARVVAVRGASLQALPPGALLAVSLGPEAVQPFLNPSLALAIVNAPSACVVAGPGEAVTELESRLTRKGVASRRLDIPRAFQSAMVDPALGAVESAVAAVERRAPAVPMVSTVTGRLATAEITEPQAWGRHLRHTLYFADAVRDPLKDASRVFVEIGPGMTLSNLARQNLERGGRRVIVNALPDFRERKAADAQLLSMAGRLWVSGVNIDWDALHAGRPRRRIPLPGYQFGRRKYWVEPRAHAGEPVVASGPRRASLDDMCALPTWKQSPLRVAADCANDETAPGVLGRWLVLDDVLDEGTALADAIAATGIDVTRVCPGETFSPGPGTTFTLRSQEPADYLRLVEALREIDEVPSTVVYGWGLSGLRPAPDGEVDDRTFYALLHLVQAMSHAGWCDRGVTLIVMTCEVYDVDGREAIDPARALVLGPAVVVGHEWPRVVCRHVDVGRADLATVERLAGQIRREVEAASEHRSIALRGRQRFVRGFEPIRLTAAADGSHPRLRTRGVYLVTGGFGGIGATLAEALAAGVQARLVLIGRHPLPPAETWDDWIAAHAASDDAADEVTRRIGIVRGLEARGAEVMSAAGDVASEPEMSAVVQAALERFGRIDGVIHAAGVLGNGPIPLKTRAAADAVMRPKVVGTQVLGRVLRGQDLDFFVLCSSLASLVGNPGQVDYCAANAFLDAWALQARRADGDRARVVSINWDTWRDVGMAVAAAVPAGLQTARDQLLRKAITPLEGAEIFRRILAEELPQVVVATVPIVDRVRPEARRELPVEERPLARHPRPALQTAFIEPRSALEKEIAAEWAAALGLESVGIDDNFFDLGGDSLTALQVIARYEAKTTLTCTVTDFYAAPTIRMLVERLSQVRGDVLRVAAPVPV